jgi:hypothetical protein
LYFLILFCWNPKMGNNKYHHQWLVLSYPSHLRFYLLNDQHLSFFTVAISRSHKLITLA